MASPQTKDEILAGLEESAKELLQCCSSITPEQFFRQPADKWSVAQNITHLTTSAKMTGLAYRLPKFVVRLYTGKPNRASRTYDALVEKYNLKLSEGGKASGRFIAKPVNPNTGKTTLLLSYGEQMEALHGYIRKGWTNEKLDLYLAPHPLLGKITLRELGFFTIYHTYHHLRIIRERLNDQI
jgi:hypothetical protein